MNYAADIKRAVTTADACRAYGIHINAAGFAQCPFHREKTASMKIYPGDRGWNCFGCGQHGDVIDLVAGLYGLTFMEAISKLNDDFHVGLPINRKIGQNRREAAASKAFYYARQKDAQNRHFSLLKAEYDAAVDLYHTLNNWADTLAPKTPDDELCDLWSFACVHLSTAGELLDRAEARLNNFLKNERNYDN